MRYRIPHPVVRSALLALACAAAFACSSGGGHHRSDAVTAFAVVGPATPEAGTQIALARFAELLDQATPLPVTAAGAKAGVGPGTLVFAIGSSATADALIAPEETAALPPGGYVLRRGVVGGAPVIAAVGPDDLGTQYGAYAILARLGFGFFHPEETFVPDGVALPASLDETWRPSYRVRGMHVHTMHPIELMDTLLVPSDDHLAEAKRYIDWLVANRQNYFQWVLQDTIDVGAWVPYAAAIVEYAHARGIEVGIDTPLEFIQQNGFVLAPDPGPFEPQVDANLALLMPAGWDVVNVELGTGEAIPADDVRQFDMLNHAAERVETVYGARLTAK
ncbi:MAG: hypothetical protein KC466_19235, partial [Myxococcales bacterium]|nr:hypothetical protein [Myxococcales bacterium]